MNSKKEYIVSNPSHDIKSELTAFMLAHTIWRNSGGGKEKLECIVNEYTDRLTGLMVR